MSFPVAAVTSLAYATPAWPSWAMQLSFGSLAIASFAFWAMRPASGTNGHPQLHALDTFNSCAVCVVSTMMHVSPASAAVCCGAQLAVSAALAMSNRAAQRWRSSLRTIGLSTALTSLVLLDVAVWVSFVPRARARLPDVLLRLWVAAGSKYVARRIWAGRKNHPGFATTAMDLLTGVWHVGSAWAFELGHAAPPP